MSESFFHCEPSHEERVHVTEKVEVL